ncbi:hypothetical protein [Bartonella rattimassiliensis]|uniref:Uncharacterized protein n=1 Tax=Bartonella rattimassiliensis 15908 TaxID=1094556 RepID=J0Z7C9_9HYPH|nr:hypothetical protein [Bartonella rattimassiliensis]EJF83598.1 hypothetical protein MCY_01182 [Bartonella rattimassiliensis 15908]
MSLIALIVSCIVNWFSCYAIYTNLKNIKMLRQEIDEKGEIINEQEKLIQKLSLPNVSYCVNCSKIVCREVI